MALNNVHPHQGGPIPKFNDFHIWKTFYCLSKESPIGRKSLATMLGIGEGSIRTILSTLQEEGAILIRKNGVSLTPEGRKIWSTVEMNIAPLESDTLTIGQVNCAVHVPGAARSVNYGCEQRDIAIKSGAAGATTLIYTNNILIFPGNDFPLDKKSDKALRSVFNLENGDAVIIGTATDYAAAEEGAVSAALHLIGGLKIAKKQEETKTSMGTINDIIALSFMVHDLVGGLPVCSKGKDDLGIRIENGAVIDNAYTGDVLEEVLRVGTTIRRIATSGPYKGVRVIVTPLEYGGKTIAAIGVVDVRSMAGVNNLIRSSEDEDL